MRHSKMSCNQATLRTNNASMQFDLAILIHSQTNHNTKWINTQHTHTQTGAGAGSSSTAEGANAAEAAAATASQQTTAISTEVTFAEKAKTGVRLGFWVGLAGFASMCAYLIGKELIPTWVYIYLFVTVVFYVFLGMIFWQLHFWLLSFTLGLIV